MAAILDSQSVRTTRRGGVRGYDAGKKIVGRKRHLLVDTDGPILKVHVHAADVQDRDGATLVLDQIDEPLSKLELNWADGGYAGAKLAGWMTERFGERPLRLEIVKRTLGWLNNFCRLSKDYFVPHRLQRSLHLSRRVAPAHRSSRKTITTSCTPS